MNGEPPGTEADPRSAPMNADYVIRKAEVGDARALATVHVRSWQSSYRGILPQGFLDAMSVKKRVESWRRRLADSPGITFVGATRAGDLVGFCDAGPNRAEPERFGGEIYAIYLLDEAKRHGLGRALFLAAAEWLRRNDMPSYVVWVLAENAPARRFYESLGGRLIAEKPLSIGGEPYAGVAYGWGDESAR